MHLPVELFFQASHLQRKKLYDVRSVYLGLLQANLCFKFAGSGKIRRIRNTLMQVWITGYGGVLLEAIGLFVDEAELYFLFGATNCHFPS